jgi:hypothetical protein
VGYLYIVRVNYKFGSKFDTTEFVAQINIDSKSDTLDDTRATLCLKMPPSEAINAYGLSST